MSFSNRVYLPFYVTGFIIASAAGGYYWFNSGQGMTWFVILMVSILANHYLLINGLSSIVTTMKSTDKPSVTKILFSLLGKTIILGGAIFMVMRYAKENIYIALLLYIFQLIILFISIKKNAQKV